MHVTLVSKLKFFYRFFIIEGNSKFKSLFKSIKICLGLRVKINPKYL